MSASSAAVGGYAPLVGDDIEAVAIGRQRSMVLAKLPPWAPTTQLVRRIRWRVVGVRQSEFAVALGAAVDAQRVGGIVLRVGALLGAVEDVVGGVVDEEGAEPRGLLAKNTRRNGVDRDGRLAVGFGLVDGGVGGGVDDDVGACITNQLADSFWARKVAFRQVDRNDFAERRQAALEFEADLAVLAGEEEFHLNPRTACRPSSCTRRW